ncbi:MAG: hypothetical protein KKA90_04685 [Nanoarchaeota archaeon]|nr:hypothetical protein [Nanoarchaeota archaeon]
MASLSPSRGPLVALLSVVVVLGVSGCTGLDFLGWGQSSGGTGPGVAILDFLPDFDDVFSGESVRFQLRVQNQGEVRARNVVAELTGIDVSEWGMLGGTFTSKQLGDLLPYDPVTNIPGEIESATFTNLHAPSISKGLQHTYTPRVRVSYDYATVAQKPITVVDAEELTNIKQRGGTLPSKVTTYTQGPLAVEITMQDYKKTSGVGIFGDSYDIFPVHIKITNLLHSSGGNVIQKTAFGGAGGYGIFDTATHPVTVKIEPPSGTQFVYSSFGDDCSSFSVPVDLFQGRDADITCELVITNPPIIQEERILKVELDYRYYVDAVTQIQVSGNKDPGSLFPF